MHIVHVLTRLLRAGSEENTVATCAWQAAAGHRVTLVHGSVVDPLWIDNLPPGVARIGVPDLVHPVSPGSDLRALHALEVLYRDLQPDIIHTHQSKAGILGRIAARVVPDAGVVHGIHILPFEGVGPARRAIYIAAERRAARHTHLFLAVSEATGRAYIEARIAATSQVHCVRSGMDLARFRASGRPDDWRTLLGIPPSSAKPPTILMMAAFEPRKRHAEFLQALSRQKADLCDLRVILAGRGPEEHRLRAEVQRLGLAPWVRFAGHRPDPEALFELADLSVLTSEREGLPRVAVQSIAAGCPIVIQDLPGIAELVTHGANGWVTDPTDMDGTVQRVLTLLRNRALLDQLGEGARTTDLSDWALDTLGRRTTELYSGALPPALGRLVRAA